MKHISSAEAFREINRWNSNSLFGLSFSRVDTFVVFSLQHASLEVRATNLFFSVSGATTAMLHAPEDAKFALADPSELKEERWLRNLSFETCLRITFPNKDVALIYPEKTAERKI